MEMGTSESTMTSQAGTGELLMGVGTGELLEKFKVLQPQIVNLNLFLGLKEVVYMFGLDI